MEQVMTWWQILAVILGAVGGGEFIKWLFNRKTEKRLNNIEVKQKDFDLDEKRITELHASIDKANELNDNLLERLSHANAALDKHIDRNRELSDRLYKTEQEVNRVNDALTEEQHKTASLERRLGAALRASDHYREWRCERSDCKDPRGRMPPNPSLNGKVYTSPRNAERENTDSSKTEKK
jgi:DNA repair exonuclease SbcCD ATPase subunit|nr:hypothetical protein [Bacteroides intestinalis]